MTVIAWDGNTLAADRKATSGDYQFAVTKIKRLRSGELIATCDNTASGLVMIKWYENGADKDKFPESQKGDDWSLTLIVGTDRSLRIYEKFPEPIIIEEPFTAIGSGREYALAAMAMGADAKTAVEIACRFSPGCGLGVDILNLEGK